MRMIPVTARAGAEPAERPKGELGKRLGDNRLSALGGYTYRLHDYIFINSWRIGNSRILGGFVNGDLSSHSTRGFFTARSVHGLGCYMIPVTLSSWVPVPNGRAMCVASPLGSAPTKRLQSDRTLDQTYSHRNGSNVLLKPN